MDEEMDDMRTRRLGALSVAKVNSLKERGFYADGGNLYLSVAPGGTKSWVFRYKENGKARDMGLGPTHTITLAEAREKALEQRKLRLEGYRPPGASDAPETGCAARRHEGDDVRPMRRAISANS
jgi:Arm DNA-binding domain